jgi:hypothetical protein
LQLHVTIRVKNWMRWLDFATRMKGTKKRTVWIPSFKGSFCNSRIGARFAIDLAISSSFRKSSLYPGCAWGPPIANELICLTSRNTHHLWMSWWWFVAKVCFRDRFQRNNLLVFPSIRWHRNQDQAHKIIQRVELRKPSSTWVPWSAEIFFLGSAGVPFPYAYETLVHSRLIGWLVDWSNDEEHVIIRLTSLCVGKLGWTRELEVALMSYPLQTKKFGRQF